ncbi:P-type conjugative transfer protein TrbJ [uncultured Sphingomonas sp.]|uniref:P-type conjugative transfer protein TrbJ n=1 Tax=uncultured Sphingomonas sp. TaxID=158754 RepID=UPI0026012AB1|nr:P-type conjugative transfer protein TrbJ [uncultured Sphingomonas sp.]
MVFGLALIGTIATGWTQPAFAQIAVYDPSNFSQNVLTAARALQQVNNQVRSLQNEATMLLNQAKNLATVGFPEIQALTQKLQQIDRLIGQAQGIQFQVAATERQYRQMFPASFDAALTSNQQARAARGRLDASIDAFGRTMAVQSEIVENVATDAQTLNGIVARSQGSPGALAAQQATNQLLALTAKQQFQLQSMMAAQYRAEALEQARRIQMESDARAANRKFLGSGSAYTPLPRRH